MNFGAINPILAGEPATSYLDGIVQSTNNKTAFNNIEIIIKGQFFSFIRFGNTKSLKELLDGLDLPQKTKYFRLTMQFETEWAGGKEELTPLKFACLKEDVEAVKLLIGQGAPVNDFGVTSAESARSSLHIAVDNRNKAITQLLLDNGAVDQLASCEAYYAYRTYSLIEGDGLPARMSALHMSIMWNSYTLTNMILSMNAANVLDKASGQNSCLHLATIVGNKLILELLAEHGAGKILEDRDQCDLNVTDLAVILRRKNLEAGSPSKEKEIFQRFGKTKTKSVHRFMQTASPQ